MGLAFLLCLFALPEGLRGLKVPGDFFRKGLKMRQRPQKQHCQDSGDMPRARQSAKKKTPQHYRKESFSNLPAGFRMLPAFFRTWRTADNKYYTNKVMGASAAAPSVSGTAALSYQAKPDMTVSQLRYLLAKTARNDTMLPTLALTPQDVYDDIYQETIVYDCGWQDNAAGFRFSNWYGFGVIDAGALVKAALECDKDPVCAGMAELPEMYVSSGKNPCAYTDDSRRLITCSFSDFQNEDGEPLGQTELTLDAVTYDVSGLSYLPEGIIEACELAASDEDAEVTEHNVARKHAVFKANVLLELIAESESGTRSLLKPVYTNWDYHSGFNVPEYYDDYKEVKSAYGTAPESLEIPPPPSIRNPSGRIRKISSA